MEGAQDWIRESELIAQPQGSSGQPRDTAYFPGGLASWVLDVFRRS